MDQRFVVDTNDLAELLSISDRRVQQLAAEGVLPRLQDPVTAKEIAGRWYAPGCIRAFVAFKIQTARASSGNNEELDTQLKSEKLRRARAEADLREDLRDRERAKLFHAEDVMTVLSDCMSQIKAKVLALPARLTLPLLGQRDATVVNQLLTEAVVELLGTIRNYSPEDFRSPDLPELLDQAEEAEQESEVSE